MALSTTELFLQVLPGSWGSMPGEMSGQYKTSITIALCSPPAHNTGNGKYGVRAESGLKGDQRHIRSLLVC